ncbi:hypothetical protein HPO_02387 [Hyphomonas polymorpha PS728]|uniref:Uncharacterized protein n=2 Tax=Hyphomonas polymorpha TaxID=74319 RepID=A0A062VNB5_9PROT|nr:hypothetical protein [Hyphomonas sp. CACIAM 19H1]KDA00225.1 hypothetical protein HPO_02387 [Hyphomonas polymorpha PS728]
MTMLAALRRHPDFAGFFDLVFPLFWPMLAWQLVRASKQLAAMGRGPSLVRVHWWGGITIAYLGDRTPDPSAYRPVTPLRAAWDDPIWSTAVPAFLNAEARAVIFPCASGGFEGKAFALQMPREGMKGACTLSPITDTS